MWHNPNVRSRCENRQELKRAVFCPFRPRNLGASLLRFFTLNGLFVCQFGKAEQSNPAKARTIATGAIGHTTPENSVARLWARLQQASSEGQSVSLMSGVVEGKHSAVDVFDGCRFLFTLTYLGHLCQTPLFRGRGVYSFCFLFYAILS